MTTTRLTEREKDAILEALTFRLAGDFEDGDGCQSAEVYRSARDKISKMRKQTKAGVSP